MAGNFVLCFYYFIIIVTIIIIIIIIVIIITFLDMINDIGIDKKQQLYIIKKLMNIALRVKGGMS